jgi:hypothetical protein
MQVGSHDRNIRLLTAAFCERSAKIM